MKKLFILILIFISIKTNAQFFRLGFDQIKFDSVSIIPKTVAGDPNFIQVDSNWVKLFSGSGSGEVNTASNLGGGLANFDSKSGVDLRFNSFKALDFDLSSNVISLDYTNGQAASSLQNGYLSAGDWSIFNSKQAALTITTVGNNLIGLTNPSAITFIVINADNTVTARSASDFKTDLSLGNVENTALSTWAGSTNLITFGTNSVSNSELAQMANATVKGRNTAGTGDPEDVTMTQLQSLLGITNVIKSSDQTTASITMVDVSEIEFPVAANANYIFEISGRFGCSSTQGMKVTMTTPAGATLECSSFGNAGTGLLFSGNVIITASGTESNTFGTNAVSIWLLLMKGSLRNGGTAGDVKLQFRSINGANTVTIFSGMTLTANRIN